MNREHTLELLTLLAVVALVQRPAPEAFPVDLPESGGKTALAAEIVPAPWHRLDPVALLQASVPEEWRVQLPPLQHDEGPVMTC